MSHPQSRSGSGSEECSVVGSSEAGGEEEGNGRKAIPGISPLRVPVYLALHCHE